MTIYCNGEQSQINDDCSLFSFLSQKEFIEKKGFAVAVNNSVIQKHNWKTFDLQENDNILIISATKGG